MTNSFQTFSNRKDRSLTVFKSENAKALLKALSCNSYTGYVVENANGSVSIPLHYADKVADELVKEGWVKN